MTYSIIGNVVLTMTPSAVMAMVRSPASIIGNVALTLAPSAWMTQIGNLDIENSLFEFWGLTASLTMSEPEQFNLENYLPGLDANIFMLEPFGMTSELPSLYSEILVDPAGIADIDSLLPVMMLDFVTTAHGIAAFDSMLSGIRLDADIHSVNEFDFTCLLSPIGSVGFALAGDFAIGVMIPSLSFALDVDVHIEFEGALSALSSSVLYSDFEIVASGEVQILDALPSLTGQFDITGYTADFSSTFPGLTHELIVVRNGDMAIQDAQLRLTADWGFYPVVDVTIDGHFPGLALAFATGDGVSVGDFSFTAPLPLLKGERIFDTATKTCQTRYL